MPCWIIINIISYITYIILFVFGYNIWSGTYYLHVDNEAFVFCKYQ